MAVIETRDLRKQYGGVEALKGVSLTVDPGQIYGLLGHNGAGKSTMIKILLGIVNKTDGEATLLGQPVGTTEIPSSKSVARVRRTGRVGSSQTG